GHPMPWVLVLGGAEGVAMGGLFFGLYTLLTDAMDHARDAASNGAANGAEGVLAGVFVMVEKATAALGTFVFSAIMSAVGFVSAQNAGSVQPAGVVGGITLAMSVLPALAAVAACLFLRAPAAPRLAGAARVAGIIAVPVALALGAGLGALPTSARAADAPPANGVTIPQVYTGPDGRSHLGTVTLPRAPGSDPLAVNARLYTTDAEIGVSPPGTFIDFHRVSTPRLLVVLAGTLEVGFGDGSTHRLHAGDIVLAADTTGQGHTSRSVGDVPVMAMTVRLPREDPLRSRASSCPDGMAGADCVANGLSITHPKP
ncbi:MAG TPA: MFS transporter, partial [Novosphingobium sp.]|nr:MFS transporter [Novosphingobium sp.]